MSRQRRGPQRLPRRWGGRNRRAVASAAQPLAVLPTHSFASGSTFRPHQWWCTGGRFCLCGVGEQFALHRRQPDHRSRGTLRQGDCEPVCLGDTGNVTAGTFRRVTWQRERAATVREDARGAPTAAREGAGGKSRLGTGGAAALSPAWWGGRDCQVPSRRSCLSLRYGAAGPEGRRAPRTPTVTLGQPSGQLPGGVNRAPRVQFCGHGRGYIEGEGAPGRQVVRQRTARSARVLHGCHEGAAS